MAEDLFNVEIEVEDRVYGAEYPTIQWLNGDPRQKPKKGEEADIGYTGGFFVSADQGIDEATLLSLGFKPFTLITRKNEHIEGYGIAQLKFAPIRWRQCWVYRPDQGLSRRFGWNSYEAAKALGKVSSRLHVLSALPGLEEPIVLSFGGNVGKEMASGTGSRGVLLRFNSKVVNAARRLSRRKGNGIPFPNCAFFLTVGPSQGDDGSPVFSTVGEGDESSTVVFPAWVDEPTKPLDQATLTERFVGPENLKEFQGWHKEASEWADAWSDIKLAQAQAQIDAGRQAQRAIAGGVAGELTGDAEGVPF